MRAVVQRVSKSSVIVEGEVVGSIGKGFVVLLGVGSEDTIEDAEYLAEKIINLRVFDDNDGKMNYSLRDVEGELLAISQFTLYGDCRKGRRPSFTAAAGPMKAESLYEEFIDRVMKKGIRVATGRFQTSMQVEIYNEGPVTLLLSSEKEY